MPTPMALQVGINEVPNLLPVLRFGDVLHLTRSKTILMPNFDQISKTQFSPAMQKFWIRFQFWAFRHLYVILQRSFEFYVNYTTRDRIMTSCWFHKMAAVPT